MAQSHDSLEAIDKTHSVNGLLRFGSFEFDHERTGILIGNAGPSMWQSFSRSQEYRDGKTDPLNRWTKRVLSNLAEGIGCEVVYPFDKPFPPFQQYAIAATGAKSSPLGLLIHPKFGLWHAFRGVLILQNSSEIAVDVRREFSSQISSHPCDTCLDKPCLTTCPVGAFSLDGLDVSACFKHLYSDETPNCMKDGCVARNACPVGKGYKYDPDQLAFHMKAYKGK